MTDDSGARLATPMCRSAGRGSPGRFRLRARAGVTLIELMIGVAVIGILAAIAGPQYLRHRERAKVSLAIIEIRQLDEAISAYEVWNRAPPPRLDLVTNGPPPLDPWDNPYEYLDYATGAEKPRKDKKLKPINSSFDLYRGPDGESKTPLTAKASRDDIVRANDGAYIGVAADY